MSRLALGLDSSTQSLTGVVVDIDKRAVVCEHSLDYRVDKRLGRFDIDENYILPGRPGEANQPAEMYMASLDALLGDLCEQSKDRGFELSDIAVINVSGQQHGHVLLNKRAQKTFELLNSPDADLDSDICSLLAGALAVPFARIWKTSFTGDLTDQVRQRLGGKEEIIEVTGSNAPWRFSAFGIMKTALEFPAEYADTRIIHQISSFIPAVLVGNTEIPVDFGNACGTSLMDYRQKKWCGELIEAVGKDLPGGAEALVEKLPDLASGLTLVGKVAGYFVKKYGLNADCRVGVGSGDNPQTKVLIQGSLLSLGSSFVNMVDTDGETMDMRGYTNAMYDALDRPFVFGCRVNGGLCWDKTRGLHGVAKDDYGPGDEALAQTPAGNNGRMFVWLADNEAFPICGACGPTRCGYEEGSLASDYAGVVESSLGSIYLNSEYFMAPDDKIYVAGGATSSGQILRRIAGIWNRDVIAIETGGAALGAAVSGACALLSAEDEGVEKDEFSGSFLRTKKAIKAEPVDVKAYHRENGYLNRLKEVESRVIEEHPM